ncbi:hypothetical protein [Dactylosporangium darangshiense]
MLLRPHGPAADEEPAPCPPSAVWLLREQLGRVVECRFSYVRPPQPR